MSRGSIINYRAFMVGDEIDTDIVCMTNVSVLKLSREALEDICARRSDLKQVFHRQQFEMHQLKKPLALDYITPVNLIDLDDRRLMLHKQELKMRLKNAIMQQWTKIKVANKKPSFADFIKGMQEAEKDGHPIDLKGDGDSDVNEGS
jgi:hypothetical protein